MTPLRWTRTRPTVDGYYWLRGAWLDSIVRVETLTDGRRIIEAVGSVSETTMETVEAHWKSDEWAGPIAPPEEGP